MRHRHYTLTSHNVTNLTVRTLLAALAWTSPRVEPKLLIQLLVRAAAQMRSLAAVVATAKLPHCLETIRTTIYKLLPKKPLEFLPVATRMLHQQLPPALRGRPLTMAVDLHFRPYYGKKTTRGICRGARKASTRIFFTYATLIIIQSGRAYTVGVTPVTNREELTAVLQRLIAQAHAAGLIIGCLLLDRGFYAAKVFVWLQKRSLAFIVPMIRRGRKSRRMAGCTGTQKFFVAGRSGWDSYTWTSPSRRNSGKGSVTVTVDVGMAAVAPKRRRKRRRKVRRQQLAYACHGMTRYRLATIVTRYRHRFGIETSYRQLGQCLAVTCSRNATYRFLLVVIALVLRNLWVWLHAERLATRPTRGKPRLQLAKLRLLTFMSWLVKELDSRLQTQTRVVSER